MPDLPETFDGSQPRPLGCLPRTAEPGALFATLEEKIPLIPREQWRPVSLSHLHWTIIDQDGIGSCNACAAVQALMIQREYAGLPRVELSSGCLYGQINGGRDAGSLLGDALIALKVSGTTSAKTIGHLQWRNSTWPRQWAEEAKKYRILEAYDCPTFDHVATAILRGFLVDYGILVGDRFVPDAEGFIPPPSGRERGGHAMCGVGLVRHNGRWYVETINSWGSNWGLSGVCFVPEDYFRGIPWTDAWAVRAAIAEIDQLAEQ